MAASAPVLGTTQDAPRPVSWTYELTEQDKTEMQMAIEHFPGCTLVGRLVGTTPSRATVREWIESALGGFFNEFNNLLLLWKVKVGADSDSTSLYTLCRCWLRNDAPRKEQPGVQNFAKLPKPLPAKNVSTDNITAEENESEDTLEDYLNGEIEAPEEQELLDSHITQFKHVRKRLREQHKQRIERYKLRLALLLQPSPYQEKLDASMHC
ncbi:hypothetical protein L7F22_001233 [Adiantum nelumboides]|nr:hypothetical protein [Adiantum nelumboides]